MKILLYSVFVMCGKYLVAAQASNAKVIINTLYQLAKPEYSVEEYPPLRGLVAAIIQAKPVDVIFQQKNK